MVVLSIQIKTKSTTILKELSFAQQSFQNEQTLAHIFYFAEPNEIGLLAVWAEQHATVPLISAQDQPGRKQKHHYIRKAKSLLS